MTLILTVAAIVAGYLYLAAVCWRVGHPRKHGHVVWSRPRPTRMLRHGSHARPRKPSPVAEPETVEPAGLAVAA
ncbi:hypothetical protein [Actinomadura madurae]|uniref:hypothetical protein n=1 Tax=Actinomadura madurae TaxID=1993 RepID=UPI0020D201E6|nr:hypothetical protein [Actinomadura madurae]MCP9947180.1 hypothetical protein [Actinomadura madurae]MCP9963946.1 hypothetical protein [Actinomadura madurae]MCP9976420.1 hypothetical protein [Actinomadura madurae]MCQ0012087.1 hypothetical protein [Actinomadura madurae]MCQ0012613.1 hypothetical protein [Actinomadura madurae]